MIGGEAGFGIKVTGQMFSRLCVRGGLQIFDYTEYPSLIRGGHNSYHITVRDVPVRAPVHAIDLLVALNQETIALHTDRLSPGAGIIFDPDDKEIVTQNLSEKNFRLYPVPFKKIAKEAGGNILMRNVVALGATVALVQFDLEHLRSVIHTAFDRKGKETVEQNLRAAEAGYLHILDQFEKDFPWILKTTTGPKRMNMSGNTAISLGAIQAGCKYFAAYPMTPATSILSFLAKNAEKTGMVVRHAEDEIAVINSAIGASYAGARSMVATAGGGYALMVEGTGLAGMLEVPLVIVEAQRPGPATGLPTWTSQADLQFVLHAAQDDFPRIIIAPGDVRECFYATFQAFNLADQFQTPVFVLTDKFIGESTASVESFTTDHLHYDRGLIEHAPEGKNGMFDRYRVTENGISPRTLPGTANGVYTANSDEHTPVGAVSESAENRIAMMDKRMKKLETARREIPAPTLYGDANADLTLVCWGSTKGPALDAMDVLVAEGKSVNVLHFVYLHPLPAEKVLAILKHCNDTLLIEGNYTGQFGKHLITEVGFLPEHTLFQYDGRPFYTDTIVAKVRSLLKA